MNEERELLERQLDEEILHRAKIMTQRAQHRMEIDRLDKEKSESTYQISRLRFQINEREDDK